MILPTSILQRSPTMSSDSLFTAGELHQSGLLDSGDTQFRLVRIQLFNWGTFSGLVDVPIARSGYLFVGPSGSGKSTILDAHAALLTPPKWVDFNVAARESERHGRDRNAITYLRGAWSQQTAEAGDYAVQYLRTGTTWSAIAETYDDGAGRAVTLVQVLWVRGTSSAPGDARRLYLVFERDFDLQGLEVFPQNDFDVRRLKAAFPEAPPFTEFSAYQERFRRLLGIDRELALRLLHKTQSAKNLGDLNVFLRDFMLDPPDTFGIADRLVAEFNELDAAHRAVVTAREQIDTLLPARNDHLALFDAQQQRTALQTLQIALPGYCEHLRKRLIDARSAELVVALDGAEQEAQRLARVADAQTATLSDLQRQKAGMALGLLGELQREMEAAQDDKPERIRKRGLAAAACAALGWDLPDDTVGFVKRVADAAAYVHEAGEREQALEQRKDELKARLIEATRDFAAARAEVAALERQSSNLPARLLELRRAMSEELGIAEARLPFVGELIEVRPEASAWQGAIERVLGGFARSILVEDRYYGAVSAYLNERFINGRLAYFRVMPRVDDGSRSAGPQSLVRKLRYAAGPFESWLRDELKAHFDFECVDTLQAFRHASRAVTREGQVKHNASRHEKNDRNRVDDRSQWVLGFDNRAKHELFRERAAGLGARVAELQGAISAAGDEGRQNGTRLLHCQTLANLRWQEVDLGSLLGRIDDLERRLAAERAARPEIAELDRRIADQQEVVRGANKAVRDEEVRAAGLRKEVADLGRRLDRLLAEYPQADEPSVCAPELEARFTAVGRAITLESLDQVSAGADRRLSEDLRGIEARISELGNRITTRFAEFSRRWPAEAGGLDATLQAADDFFAKLTRLQTDNLPAYEERFFRLLREQSDQNLTLLSTRLDLERSTIRTRIELVNESLASVAFNRDTHLGIETADRTVEEVRQFRAGLKEALSRSIGAEAHDQQAQREAAERRFAMLAALVRRLSSQDAVDRSWRALVLDVRQHVEFVARELDADDNEVEVYRSGAGKSGGQRQKLAATCLAAALRYQLGGRERALPAFCTVVLDEAFDKADADFTRTAMEIFRTFGFQMIVATPMKSVMTLEPFIGGACYVHIRDRKWSSMVRIDYDDGQQRLKFPETEEMPEPVDAAIVDGSAASAG